MEETKLKADQLLRVDLEVKQAIVNQMQVQESYNDVLRRILKLDKEAN